jgi:hypothetical protein
MPSRAYAWGLVLCAAVALVTSSCSKNPTSPKAADPTGPPAQPPDSYPAIPRPSTPNAVTPDTSEVYSANVPVVGKQVDFAPVWSGGVFTWTIDAQTQKGPCLACAAADPPGSYWNGTAPNSALSFENGAVDLRSPTPDGTSQDQPHPRRVEFVQSGVVVPTPFNPDKNDVDFTYENYPWRHIAPGLFGGYVITNVTPAFGEQWRHEVYFVAATSCPQLTNPVFIKRERFWQRVPLTGGTSTRSIRVDPGAQFQVSYMRTQGVNFSDSYSFTQTLNGEVSLGSDKSIVGGKLGGSLQQMFGNETTVQAETSMTVTRTFNGIDGKTVVYSVWSSVERYTFVDQNGNPYTDPNFTFSSLGSAVIKGEYEWISSTSFPYGGAAQTAAARGATEQGKAVRVAR